MPECWESLSRIQAFPLFVEQRNYVVVLFCSSVV